MRKAIISLAWISLIAVQSASGQNTPKPNSILYTGQLDGFAGSAARCAEANDTCGQQLSATLARIAEDRASTTGTILVGMGDNFAPDPGGYFNAQTNIHERLDPDFRADHFRAIDFMHNAKYDAAVPGVQDFYFGAEFVRRSQDVIGMVATNLVRTPVQPSTCPAYPQLPTVTILLPNQISSSIQSGSSSGAGGASGGASGAGGGGAGHKGGKKGGGSSSTSAGNTATGGASTGAAPTNACQPKDEGESHRGQNETSTPRLQWPDANSIYPWTSQISLAQFKQDPSSKFKVAMDGEKPKVYFCTPEAGKLKQLDLTTCFEPDSSTLNQEKSTVDYSIDTKHLGVDQSGFLEPLVTQKMFRLFGGASGRICYVEENVPKDKVDHSCITIQIQEPLFKYAWRTPAGTPFVILGVLAPDTLNGLSDIDTSWYKEKNDSEVPRKVAINDPTSAIIQALHTFDLLNPKHPVTGVLLAQMSPGEAKTLADSLGESSMPGGAQMTGATPPTRINVIFSAADPVESTPKMTVEVNAPGQGTSNPNDPYFIPVFTPAPTFQRADCLAEADPAKCFPRLEVQNDQASNLISLTNIPATITPVHPPALPSWSTPFCADSQIPKGRGPQAASAKTVQDWECDLLENMMKDISASPALGNSSDIAIMEEKYFDFARTTLVKSSEDCDPRSSGVLPAECQSQQNGIIEAKPDKDEAARILWKAGRLARVSLMGSTIETLLQQNDKLQGSTFQVLPSSRGKQQLKILGITKVGKIYYINGTQLSENQVYSIATTDRLANTTSDYSQLAQVDLDSPNLFPARGQTVVISDIGSSTGTFPANPAPNKVQLYAANSLEGIEFTHTHKDLPPDAKPPSFSYSNRTIPEKNTTQTDEKNEQLRPLFRATVEQVALSYSSATPNQSDPNIGANFGGVSNPNVSAAYSSSASAVENARLEWYAPQRSQRVFEDIGLDDLLNIAEVEQGSLASPTVPAPTTTTGALIPEKVKSLTANNITLSPFLELQAPKLPEWKALVFRLIASDNIAHPVPQYLAGCSPGKSLNLFSGFTGPGTTALPTTCATPTGGTDEFQFSLNRSWTLGESVGSRWEKNDFHYVEVGFTHQRAHEVLSAVGVVNAGTPALSYYCNLIGSQSLSTCAGDLPAEAGVTLQHQYSNYSQNGGYMLGLWTVPVRKRIIFQTSDFGTFFAYGNHNQSVLTHYAFNTMATLLVNLPANFSIGPTLNIFFFQDNATHAIGTSLIRKTIGGQLNYNFDWHTGVSRKEFYGNTQ